MGSLHGLPLFFVLGATFLLTFLSPEANVCLNARVMGDEYGSALSLLWNRLYCEYPLHRQRPLPRQ
jgi:hypothetical protein